MERTILRKEVMKQLDTGDPFDMIFITADRRRGTGGVIKRVHNWIKSKNDSDLQLAIKPFKPVTTQPRNPDHRSNKTFNIYNPAEPTEHAIKVHWRLMVIFNGARIV